MGVVPVGASRNLDSLPKHRELLLPQVVHSEHFPIVDSHSISG